MVTIKQETFNKTEHQIEILELDAEIELLLLWLQKTKKEISQTGSLRANAYPK